MRKTRVLGCVWDVWPPPGVFASSDLIAYSLSDAPIVSKDVTFRPPRKWLRESEYFDRIIYFRINVENRITFKRSFRSRRISLCLVARIQKYYARVYLPTRDVFSFPPTVFVNNGNDVETGTELRARGRTISETA